MGSFKLLTILYIQTKFEAAISPNMVSFKLLALIALLALSRAQDDTDDTDDTVDDTGDTTDDDTTDDDTTGDTDDNTDDDTDDSDEDTGVTKCYTGVADETTGDYAEETCTAEQLTCFKKVMDSDSSVTRGCQSEDTCDDDATTYKCYSCDKDLCNSASTMGLFVPLLAVVCRLIFQ